jgi:biopolymer transport protein ExbD
MAKFKKKASTESKIPTSSMADIAFLLLVFFMVTTVLKLEEGLPIALPKAEAAQDIPREHVLHVWVDRVGKISINDMLVTVGSVEGIVAQRQSLIRIQEGEDEISLGVV